MHPMCKERSIWFSVLSFSFSTLLCSRLFALGFGFYFIFFFGSFCLFGSYICDAHRCVRFVCWPDIGCVLTFAAVLCCAFLATVRGIILLTSIWRGRVLVCVCLCAEMLLLDSRQRDLLLSPRKVCCSTEQKGNFHSVAGWAKTNERKSGNMHACNGADISYTVRLRICTVGNWYVYFHFQ